MTNASPIPPVHLDRALEAVYRARWWNRLDEIVIAALFLLLTVGCLTPVSAWTPLPARIVFGLCFGLAAAFSLVWISIEVREVRLAPGGITLRKLFTTTGLHASQVGTVQLFSSSRTAWIKVRSISGKTHFLRLRSFLPRDTLTHNLGTWWRSISPESVASVIQSGHRFRMRSFSAVCLGASLFTALLSLACGLSVDKALEGVASALVVGVLLAFLGFQAGRDYVDVTADGIECRRIGVRKRMRWEDVSRARIWVQQHGGTQGIEYLTLFSGVRRLELSSAFDDYPLLRDAVVLRLGPDRVWDETKLPGLTAK